MPSILKKTLFFNNIDPWGPNPNSKNHIEPNTIFEKHLHIYYLKCRS